MLRTIVRREIIENGLKRCIIRNAVRCLGVQGIQYRYNKRHLTFFPHKSLNNTDECCKNFIRKYSNGALPPHFKVLLPALSPTMEMGTIVSWEKKEGDKLNEGDLLAEIETDKATMGFETPEEGYLAKILVQAGSKDVPIGKLVCIIVDSEDKIAAFKDFKPDDAAAPPKAAASPTPTPAAPASTPSVVPPSAPTPVTPPVAVAPPLGTKPGRVYASPMAKRLAEQQNIRLEGSGSGIYGSITSKDLADLAKPVSPPARSGPAPQSRSRSKSPATIKPSVAGQPSSYVDIPVTNIRAVIAKRLLQSKTTIPHYYLTMEINATKVLKVRERMNKELQKDKVRLSLNDFILKATAMACRTVPEVNSYWMDDIIREFQNCDISVAVATDKGLITPIIFQADNKGLVTISKEMKSLAAKAREGKLQPHEFQGGSISVSNLGMFDTKVFSAIINPPQSAILAIGTTQSRLVLDKESEKGFCEEKFVEVTLSCDHRVIDGATGARWLQAFKRNLEDPYSMLL